MQNNSPKCRRHNQQPKQSWTPHAAPPSGWRGHWRTNFTQARNAAIVLAPRCKYSTNIQKRNYGETPIEPTLCIYYGCQLIPKNKVSKSRLRDSTVAVILLVNLQPVEERGFVYCKPGWDSHLFEKVMTGMHADNKMYIVYRTCKRAAATKRAPKMRPRTLYVEKVQQIRSPDPRIFLKDQKRQIV